MKKKSPSVAIIAFTIMFGIAAGALLAVVIDKPKLAEEVIVTPKD